MRYFLELCFDGSNYHGWQIQINAITVQETLIKALKTYFRQNVEITGAGRTDAGVHSLQMYAHFDLENKVESLPQSIYHLNALLPKDIAVIDLFVVQDDAHARFDAISREYIYKIAQNKNPFERDRSWFFPHELNIELMNEACQLLKTFEDFSCFSKSGTQTKTNICEIMYASWTKEGEKIEFKIKANRFLRNMVRAIVGTMIEVGKGDLDLEGLKKVINSGNRSEAGFSVPAHALYLSKIEYPERILKK